MRGAIESHLGSAQVSRVIYGAIIGLALVVALEEHPPAAGVTAGFILATALAVALAEIYSEIIGTETRTHARVGSARIRGIATEAAAVACGIAVPAVFFVLASAGAIELDTAFTIAKWCGLGLIGLYGYFGGRLSGRSVPASIVHAFAVGLIGGFLIAFKALLH
jgi:VIT1/CCC1 family predicted Fe2+/Mn2+ transporter